MCWVSKAATSVLKINELAMPYDGEHPLGLPQFFGPSSHFPLRGFPLSYEARLEYTLGVRGFFAGCLKSSRWGWRNIYILKRTSTLPTSGCPLIGPAIIAAGIFSFCECVLGTQAPSIGNGFS